MGFDEFIRSVETELQELLWQDSAERTLSTELEELDGQIEECTADSNRNKKFIDQLKKKVAHCELQVAWLKERVEVFLHLNDRSNAWRHALQLDQLRQTIAKDRDELHRHQRVYSDQLVQIRRLQRCRSLLRDELVSRQ